MKILVCGDRNWSNKDTIRRVLERYRIYDPVIIEGENGVVDKKTGKVISGADKMAREVAEELGYAVKPYPADWNRYHRAAGPIRNRQMLQEQPDKVIAFHANLAQSKGTANMIRQARKAGVPCCVIA